jgi:hypothetical protein
MLRKKKQKCLTALPKLNQHHIYGKKNEILEDDELLTEQDQAGVVGPMHNARHEGGVGLSDTKRM